MTLEIDSSWLTTVRATRSARTVDTLSACLDDHALAALVDGSLDADERARAMLHLAGCDHCRGDVAAVTRLVAAPAVVREEAAIGRTRRLIGVFGVASAAAVAALMLWPRATPPSAAHRAALGTALPAVAVAPVGLVAAAPQLVWMSVAGADRYRVTLYDADGTTRYEVSVADTVVALPDSVALAAGKRHGWTIDAHVGFDRWATSGLIEFTVARDSSR
jgi:hypothetical protein